MKFKMCIKKYYPSIFWILNFLTIHSCKQAVNSNSKIVLFEHFYRNAEAHGVHEQERLPGDMERLSAALPVAGHTGST